MKQHVKDYKQYLAKERLEIRRRRAHVRTNELHDRAWMGIHARISEPDLERPFVPSPWDVPWSHPGASYFMEGVEARTVDKCIPGWLFGDNDRPLKVGGRA